MTCCKTQVGHQTLAVRILAVCKSPALVGLALELTSELHLLHNPWPEFNEAFLCQLSSGAEPHWEHASPHGTL